MTRYAVVQIENTDDWPPVAMRPWKFDTFWQMPVVLWIRENEHPGLACSFMAPCSSHFGARRLHASSTYPSGSTDSFDLQASPHNQGRWYSTLGLVPSFPDIPKAAWSH